MFDKRKMTEALKKASEEDLNMSKDEINYLVNLLEATDKLKQNWNSEKFMEEFEEQYQMLEIDFKKEMIEKAVIIYTKLIKQMKIKSEVRFISLKMKSYEYPFPPLVTIATENEELKLETEFIERKELHYEFDAISAECNLNYKEQVDVVMETYQKILSEFNQYDWHSIGRISDDFEIRFIKPY
ncbi:hypothetical protein [Neobacillus sp. YIM B06451]|uniref:hypothetical protein n=1 Tax=Neobacillus sp. YIM B06451 TaxID=3070994 RepID=UPI00292FCDF8|nr:hypothetical protein [Neobacillus sp. YIM B06451]